MASARYSYNTNLAKGTGFVNETLSLIMFYNKGESKQSFLSRCVSQNILNKSTEHRTKDIINLVFFDRYWKVDNNVIPHLKNVRENGLSLDGLIALFYVYTARANRVFFDFVLEVKQQNLNQQITNETARSFLIRAISNDKAPAWSDSMLKRVSSYLISCLKDFDLIDDMGYLSINFPDQKVVNYILHELHFLGKSDKELVTMKVWTLLGLGEYEVIKEMEKLSFNGTFIFQYSGEILKIGWNYQNMEEFIENEFR